ncbi:MAG: FAD-binding oxidoreductase [Cellvibrionales bacterium]|nr:FAD-binding oxidoreductase [Cellvibrionales bacterium]
MITPVNAKILQSALPVLKHQGFRITTRFYSILFENHPELKNLFNVRNQQSGSQQQALAKAIIRYVECLETPEKLAEMVNIIAHKHVSLGVIAEQYPIVGETLLMAIKEVLALDASDPILTAFFEAYNVLADILIRAEATLVEAKHNKTNDFVGFKSFRIERIVQESNTVKSFYFQPEDGSIIPDALPGQFISVRVKPEGYPNQQIRQYTLSDINQLRISVKKEPEGLVSSHLHGLQVGDLVELQSPSGHFIHKNSAKKSVFIAGGVGITPLFSMLKSLVAKAADKNHLMLIHCVQDQASTLFDESLCQWKDDGKIHLKRSYDKGEGADHTGYLQRSVLKAWFDDDEFTPDNTDIYLCGPAPFMRHAFSLCSELGFTDQNIHYEVFGPTEAISGV